MIFHYGKPILTSLALVGVTIVIHRCYHNFKGSSREKGKDEKDIKNDNETDTIQDQTIGNDVAVQGDFANKGQVKEIRFPWEPDFAATGSGNDSSRQSRNKDAKENLSGSSTVTSTGGFHRSHDLFGTTEVSCIKEIECLATMSFANGGIRAPSCPCCV
jgi:hypothetical protein